MSDAIFDTSEPARDDLTLETTPDASPESAFKPNFIRTRIIPAFALLMVVGLLGLLAYSLFAPKDLRPAGVQGRINSSGAIITEQGRMAPDFTLSTFDGGTFHLADYRGKIVVLNFWASWCEPCRQETPLLETAAGHLGDDVVLVGVNTGDDLDNARAFLKQYGVTYPIVRDDDKTSVAVDYGLTGYPETFVVAKDGTLAARLPGPVVKLQQLNDMIAEAR